MVEYLTYIGTLEPSKTISVRPGLIETWKLDNIFYSGTINLVKTNGTNAVTFATTITTKATFNLDIAMNCYNYVNIISADASTIVVSYDYEKL